MSKIKRIYQKLRRRYLQEINSIKLKRIHTKTSVGLVSCDAWERRVYDDLLLQKSFLKSGIRAEIISWQNKDIDFTQYDALLITSMWGYQENIDDLRVWLKKVENLKIFNNTQLIRNNFDKSSQIKILEKNNLSTIPTVIIKKGELSNSEKPILDGAISKIGGFPIVVKPSISSGGENTFLIKDTGAIKKFKKKLQEINLSGDILLQPFLPEIRNGEISVVAIDRNIVNAVVRFPGVLDKKDRYTVRHIDTAKLDSKLVKLCEKVISVKDFDDQLYIRIDVVKRENEYIIMEVELFEPQLFYYLLKGEKRKRMLNAMIEAIKKRIQK